MPGVIVPRKAVAEIVKLVEDGCESVGIELSSAKVRLTFDGVVLTSKLIDGTFPDYQRVIPAGNDKVLVVERGDFAKAVDRVSTISSERGRAVKLALARRPPDALRQQPGFGQRDGRARGRLRRGADRYRLQRPLPPRHHEPARRRHGPVQARRSRLPDRHPGPRRRPRALRPDADAGVSRRAVIPDGRATIRDRENQSSTVIPGPRSEARNHNHRRCKTRHGSHRLLSKCMLWIPGSAYAPPRNDSADDPALDLSRPLLNEGGACPPPPPPLPESPV